MRSDMTSRIEYWGSRLFPIALLLLVFVAAWQWRGGAPVSANLLELVPSGRPDALEEQAVQRMQEPLNRELLVLISHPQREQALALAAELGRRWQQQALFEKVQWEPQADLSGIRQQLQDQRLALLPAADRQLLIDNPAAFVERRVQDLFDPFRSQGVVATNDDLLGLSTLDLQDQWETGWDPADRSKLEDFRLYTDLALGATIVSAAALGVTLFLTRGDRTKKAPETTTGWRLLPSCGPDGCQLTLSLGF